jgi:hypothetical protein
MKRWFWALAVGCWIVCAVLANKIAPPSVVIFISAFGWFFIALAIGGWKGLPFGLVALVFVGCLSAVWTFFSQGPYLFGYKSFNIYTQWQKAKIFLDTLHDKPMVILAIYLGLIIVLLGILAIPVAVAVKLGKSAGGKVREKEEKAERKIRGRPGI